MNPIKVECDQCQVFINQYEELERLILKFGKWRANWLQKLWWRLFDPNYKQDVDRMQNLKISMMLTSWHHFRHYKYLEKLEEEE